MVNIASISNSCVALLVQTSVQYATAFNQDLSLWNVGSARDMENMFFFAERFGSDISTWDVSRVTSMRVMLAGATAFVSDLSDWDVSRVEDMWGMLALLPSWNHDISSWNVANAKNMSLMFGTSTSFRQDLCPWGALLDPATDVSNMFWQTACATLDDPDFSSSPPGPFCFECVPPPIGGCFLSPDQLYAAVDLYVTDPSGALTMEYGHPIGEWCVENVTSFCSLFSVERNSAMADFNEDFSGWNRSAAADMFLMVRFTACHSFFVVELPSFLMFVV